MNSLGSPGKHLSLIFKIKAIENGRIFDFAEFDLCVDSRLNYESITNGFEPCQHIKY